ncbi:MAG: hemin uptake protein HemP, partial [Paracoccaceae bacterium]|nr:hemin uptake protein HemP [Paracoccaceae bacterium]
MNIHSAPLQRTPSPPSVPVYTVTDLTKGGNQAQITLNDQIYTLRITR